MPKGKKFTKPQSKLRLFNDILSIVVIFVGVYILLTPFIPNFTFWYKKWRDNDTLINQIEKSIEISQSNNTEPTTVAPPEQNRIVVPKMQLNEPIYDGANPSNVDLGVWRRPHTSSPNAGSNTVMVGHRFFYSGSYGVFYHLDKLEVGDRIVVFWNQERYDYEVESTAIVAPTAVEIELPTPEDRLTLYTCTPIWTSKDRLVVVSKRIDPDNTEESDEQTKSESEPTDNKTITEEKTL